MHLNYFFFRRLCTELNTLLLGAVLLECFSQEKDELIIRWQTVENAEFIIRVSCKPDNPFVIFPQQYHRAGKNTAEIFPFLKNSVFEGAEVLPFDRAFTIRLSGGFSLLFKMHGKRSNVLIIDNEGYRSLFRSVIQEDLSTDFGIRKPDPYLESYPSDQDFARAFSFFGPDALAVAKQISTETVASRETVLRDLDTQFQQSGIHIVKHDARIKLLLFEAGEVLGSSNSAIEAANIWHKNYASGNFLELEKELAYRQIDKLIAKSKAYIHSLEDRYLNLLAEDRMEEYGHLLMANLHLLKPGLSAVELDDFYNDGVKISLKLNPKLDGVKNAEAYYRKAGNRKIELKYLEENSLARQQQVEGFEKLKIELSAAETVKQLRKQVAEAGLNRVQEAQTLADLPYRVMTVEGFELRIGKNAKSNDRLLQQFSFKEDLWLHARDCPGSHIIIKYRAGKGYPNSLVEKAASIAAFFSKRKGESLCPVSYTPVKFVRKPKGAAPGLVLISQEKVVMVQPKLPE